MSITFDHVTSLFTSFCLVAQLEAVWQHHPACNHWLLLRNPDVHHSLCALKVWCRSSVVTEGGPQRGPQSPQLAIDMKLFGII